MAFRIGDVYSIDEMTRDSFRQAAGEIGIGERMAMRRFDAMADRFQTALHESAEELAEEGYLKAKEIETRILRTAGMARLL